MDSFTGVQESIDRSKETFFKIKVQIFFYLDFFIYISFVIKNQNNMKLITRLAVLGLGLYLLLTTGLLGALVYLVITAGKFVIALATEEPLGAAIGLLIAITFMGAQKD